PLSPRFPFLPFPTLFLSCFALPPGFRGVYALWGRGWVEAESMKKHTHYDRAVAYVNEHPGAQSRDVASALDITPPHAANVLTGLDRKSTRLNSSHVKTPY